MAQQYLCCCEDENSVSEVLVENILLLGLNKVGRTRTTMKKRGKNVECGKERSRI